LRDIGDARPELELAPDDAIADSSAVLVPPSSVRSLGIVAGLVFAASIGGAAWWLKPASVVTEVVTRFDQPLPADRAFSHLNRHVLAISPDGTKMAYIANQQIYLRPMNQLDAQPIRGSNENPYELMFSPDGQWVAYFVAPPNPGVPGALKKLAIVGGAPVTLCPVKGVPYGGSWRGATIVFADYLAGQAGGIWAVGDSGGEPRPIVPIDDKKEFAAQPQLLADGVHVLMGVVAGSSPRQGEPDIVVQAIGQAGSRKVLVHGGSDPKLLSMGHLVYHQKGTLFGLAIDPTTFEIGGGPVPLVEGVRQGSSGAVQFAIAENGTLAYSPGGRDGPARRTLVWVDRQGHEEAVPAQPRAYVFPRLSPDGKQIAIESRDEQNDIWIWDLTRQALTRMTYGPDAEGYPVWMSDSRRVAYRLEDAKGTAIARSAADGTGTVERLHQASADAAPQSLAPDGGHLLFRGYDRQKTGRDLFLLPLDPIGPPAALVHSTFMEDNGEVSPDGRWIAYVSDESGKASEVFVRPFPLVGAGKWQASTNGGETPMWSRNGRELFFVTQVDGKDTLVGAAVSTTGSAFTYGRPAAVLPLGDYFVVSASRTFDISLDGRRFLLVKKVSEAAPPPASVTVISHWFDDVRSRMKRN
jgi:dipeptidyl aminopeptidase/acylaminoacyl peptidase